MNSEFQSLYRKLCESEIFAPEFLSQVKTIGDFEFDLLNAIQERKNRKDWGNLCVLIWAVQQFPSPSFTPLLCDLLDNRASDDLLEAIADALFEISDERSVPSLLQALDYYVPGDDDHHFNKKCLYALSKIDTKKAVDGIKATLQEKTTGNFEDSPLEQMRELIEQTLRTMQGKSSVTMN